MSYSFPKAWHFRVLNLQKAGDCFPPHLYSSCSCCPCHCHFMEIWMLDTSGAVPCALALEVCCCSPVDLLHLNLPTPPLARSPKASRMSTWTLSANDVVLDEH